MIKKLALICGLFIALVALSCWLLVKAVLSNQALVPRQMVMQTAETESLQQLLADNDPRYLDVNKSHQIALSEADLNSLLAYYFQYQSDQYPLLENASAQITLLDNSVILETSYRIDHIFPGKYLNSRLLLAPGEDLIEIQSINIGDILIPAIIQQLVMDLVLQELSVHPGYSFIQDIIGYVEKVSIENDQLLVTLLWQESLLSRLEQQARDALISDALEQCIGKFSITLEQELGRYQQAGVTRVELEQLLPHLFTRAMDSDCNGDDPVLENQAIFALLTLYMTDLDANQMFDDTSSELNFNLPVLRVTVEGRQDLARHLVITAAIAAAGNAELADILSIYKEIQDSRLRGSGFSFSDITAGLTGTHLGELATRSRADAVYFQSFIANASSSSLYLPVMGSYDGLTEEEFQQQYGSRTSTRYQDRLDSIERNIRATSIFLQGPSDKNPE